MSSVRLRTTACLAENRSNFLYAAFVGLTWTCVLLHAGADDRWRSIEAQKGDTVLMWCNTSTTTSSDINATSAVTWTQQTTGGQLTYVYVNASFTATSTTRYSIHRRQGKSWTTLTILLYSSRPNGSDGRVSSIIQRFNRAKVR